MRAVAAVVAAVVEAAGAGLCGGLLCFRKAAAGLRLEPEIRWWQSVQNIQRVDRAEKDTCHWRHETQQVGVVLLQSSTEFAATAAWRTLLSPKASIMPQRSSGISSSSSDIFGTALEALLLSCLLLKCCESAPEATRQYLGKFHRALNQ
jgi:hypothetical protein